MTTQAKAKLSEHALQRVSERLHLTDTEVLEILDNDLTVDIGTEDVRVHRLFYSTVDEMCFVAIQDSWDGIVITVLPLDYHANVAWDVSDEAQDKAKALFSTKPPVVTGNKPVLHLTAKAFKEDRSIRVFSVGAIPLDKYKGTIKEIINNEDFLREVAEKVAEKRTDEFVYAVSVTSGGRDSKKRETVPERWMDFL